MVSQKAIDGNGDYCAIGTRDARGRSRDAHVMLAGGHVMRGEGSREVT